jgi:hypothetical protein
MGMAKFTPDEIPDPGKQNKKKERFGTVKFSISSGPVSHTRRCICLYN